jgi:hypothetical protein
MTNLSQAEATEHHDRVWNEILRLRERFAQRPQPEKKRLAQLEKLLPKLKRLEKGAALSQPGHKGEALGKISDDEQKLLAGLQPAEPKKKK